MLGSLLVKIGLVQLSLLTASRLVFLTAYWDQYSSSSASQLFESLLHGIRFDAAILAILTGLPATAAFAFSVTRWRERAASSYRYFSLVFTGLLAFLLAADIVYYRFVERRISFEAVELLGDLPATLKMGMIGFPLQFVLTIALVALVSYGIWRLAAPSQAESLPPYRPIRHSLMTIALLLLFVVLGRGGVQSKPLSVNMAFRSAVLSQGHLTLNPAFTVYRYLVAGKQQALSLMPEATAVARTRQLIGLSSEPLYARYPLFQKVPAARLSHPQKNVVVIVMESFSAQFVSALVGQTPENKGLTPNLNALAKEGVLYTRFYASGTRSMEGVATVLTGLPNLPGVALIGSQVEQNTMQSLPLLLKDKGYTNLFLHGAFRGSMRFDAFAQRHGFDKFIAKQDFDQYASKSDSLWGIFDHHAFDRLHRELNGAKGPTFAFFFSLSSHTPFELPDETFRTFSGNDSRIAMKNSIAYADYSLGQFFRQARSSHYWQNTVFVITADHNMGQHGFGREERMHIPLVVLSPGDPAFPKGERRDWLGGHVDIAPTILDVVGFSGSHAFAGRSLWQPAEDRFAFFGWGSLAGWLSSEGLLVHDMEKPVAFFSQGESGLDLQDMVYKALPHTEAVRQNMEAYLQTWNNLIRQNRLMPSNHTLVTGVDGALPVSEQGKP